MNRSQISVAKDSMLSQMNDRPPEVSFASITRQAELGLQRSIADAREIVAAAARASGGSAKLETANGDVTLLDDAEFLRFGMSRAKDMIFREENRIDIGIGSGRVNKVSKRLLTAAEIYGTAAALVAETADTLSQRNPGARESTYFTAARAALTLYEWSAGDSDGFSDNVVRSIDSTGKVSLCFFVCPPVEFGYLSSDEPENYLRTTMSGSLLSRQVERLSKLFQALNEARVPYEITAIIGDTDEKEYIWPVLGDLPNLKPDLLEQRQAQLREAVKAYITDELGPQSKRQPRIAPAESVEVLRLSALANSPRCDLVLASCSEKPFGNLITAEDVAIEKERMRELWQPGGYYDGIPFPKDADLESIVLRKFASYAAQGVLIAELLPDAVLIQTELPPNLRTCMLNEGRTRLGMDPLPAIFLTKPEERIQSPENMAETVINLL